MEQSPGFWWLRQAVQELPDSNTIFITEEDYFGKNKLVYRFKMMETEDHGELEDGTETVYINGKWSGNDDIGRLMEDFRTADPSQMNPGVLRERVEFLKSIKGGEVIMSGTIEEYVQRRLKEQAIALQHQMEKEREMEREQLQKEREMEREQLQKEREMEREQLQKERETERRQLQKEREMEREQLQKERETEREQFQKESKRLKRENDAFAQVAVKSLLECGVSMEQVSTKTKLPMERVQQIARDLGFLKDDEL